MCFLRGFGVLGAGSASRKIALSQRNNLTPAVKSVQRNCFTLWKTRLETCCRTWRRARFNSNQRTRATRIQHILKSYCKTWSSALRTRSHTAGTSISLQKSSQEVSSPSFSNRTEASKKQRGEEIKDEETPGPSPSRPTPSTPIPIITAPPTLTP